MNMKWLMMVLLISLIAIFSIVNGSDLNTQNGGGNNNCAEEGEDCDYDSDCCSGLRCERGECD